MFDNYFPISFYSNDGTRIYHGTNAQEAAEALSKDRGWSVEDAKFVMAMNGVEWVNGAPINEWETTGYAQVVKPIKVFMMKHRFNKRLRCSFKKISGKKVKPIEIYFDASFHNSMVEAQRRYHEAWLKCMDMIRSAKPIEEPPAERSVATKAT